MNKYTFCLLLFLISTQLLGQEVYDITGVIRDSLSRETLIGATILNTNSGKGYVSDEKGAFTIKDLPKGSYTLEVAYLGKTSKRVTANILNQDVSLDIFLSELLNLTEEVTIIDKNGSTGIQRLRDVEGAAIYASKKTEVIKLDLLPINKAANISRQIYARVTGLNIWESDGAGVQLGLGGRGLSPNRNSNFNTRQNGYDISADALGYPESYYTPPAEAIDRIEVIRGAASLQYGTQFGGMLNFKFKEGPKDKPFELSTRINRSSYDFWNSFTSIGGTVGKLNYYGFYQYKFNKGWRPNSSLNQHNGFLSIKYEASETFDIKVEYTHSNYLAQQAGGLTDAEFASDPSISKRARNWFAVDWNLFALEWNVKITERLKWNSRTFGLIAGRDALGNLDNINLLDFEEERDFLNDDYKNWGQENRILYRYTLNELPSTLLIGVRFYRGRTFRKQGLGSAGSDPDFRYLNPDNLEGSDFELPSENVSLFAENVFNLSPKWGVTPGIRFEKIQTDASGFYRETTRDLAGNIINDEIINETKSNQRSFAFFGLGASHKPNDALEIYTNISQNYRAINFNDIRVDVGSLVVDENLTDEKGFTFDLGIRGAIKNGISYDFTAYHLAYNDRIGTILKREPNPVFNGLVDRVIRFRSNIADASIYGLESMIDFDVLKLTGRTTDDFQLNVFTNLSLTTATYDSQDPAIDGNDVELVPAFIFKTGATFGYKDFKANFNYGYTAEHFSDASNAVRTPTAIEGIIPAYDVMDLSFQYKFKQLTIETGVNNLLDNIYFTRRATGYPGPGIIPSQRRSIYLTLGYKL